MGSLTPFRTHDEERCAGQTCVIHRPSHHHMRGWPIEFRQLSYSFVPLTVRRCPHQVSHPDPDSVAFLRRMWRGRRFRTSVHECDGCCRPVGQISLL